MSDFSKVKLFHFQKDCHQNRRTENPKGMLKEMHTCEH